MVDGPGGEIFLPPLQGSAQVGDPTQGSAFGSTLGYIPAAASRLKMFAGLPGTSVIHNLCYFVGREDRVTGSARPASVGYPELF